MGIFGFHVWFDKVKEPLRMFIALLLMSPFFFGLALMPEHPVYFIVSLVYIALFATWRITYFIWAPKHKDSRNM